MATTHPPRTADGDAFRFRAGRLCLDLCSTVLWRYRAPTEQLRGPADVVRWIAAAGLRPVPSVADDGALRDAIGLREATYRSVHAHLRGERLAHADVATLNRIAAAPTAVPRIDIDGGVAWTADDAGYAALAAVARDTIDLLATQHGGRLRECAADDCAFLFLDTSRPGNRRWCAMNRCGNRQHVRDHRARHPRTPPNDDQRATVT